MSNRETLVNAAMEARERAYAPYSGYKVGAAVRDGEGRIHAGCNVENISYGLTICAERSALSRMVAGGGTQITEVAVVTADGGAPCGACRQVLLEFAPQASEVTVHVANADGG